MQPGHSFLFLVAFLVFFGVLLSQVGNYPYYSDDYAIFSSVQEIREKNLTIWSPIPKYNRRHPFFMAVMSWESELFGFKPLYYFAVLFFLHGLNSLWVGRLSRSLGGTPWTQLLSALLFLCSSAFYQQLIFIHATQRVLCVFLLLSAALSWIEFLRSRRPVFFMGAILFQILSLLTMEDAVVFPALALLLTFLIAPNGEERKKTLFGYLALLMLVGVAVPYFLLSEFFSSPLAFEKLSSPNLLPGHLASLLRMFFVPLLIPDKGFFPAGPVPEDIFRLAPFFLFSLFLFFFLLQKEWIKFLWKDLPRPLMLISIGWIGIATLPFLFQALTFEHANRYLYAPMAGFCLIFGVLMDRLMRLARLRLPKAGTVFFSITLIYILGLNLASTVYQYRRYIRHIGQEKEFHFYDRVKGRLSFASPPPARGL